MATFTLRIIYPFDSICYEDKSEKKVRTFSTWQQANTWGRKNIGYDKYIVSEDRPALTQGQAEPRGGTN